MVKIPAPSYTKEELKFAEEISEAAGFDNKGEYFTGLEPLEDKPVPLSIGNGRIRCEPHSPYDHAECGGNVQGHAAAPLGCNSTGGHEYRSERDVLLRQSCMAAGAYRMVKRTGTDPESMDGDGLTVIKCGE